MFISALPRKFLYVPIDYYGFIKQSIFFEQRPVSHIE